MEDGELAVERVATLGEVAIVLEATLPAPAPVNSTFTVVDVAAKAASRFGTTRGSCLPLS